MMMDLNVHLALCLSITQGVLLDRIIHVMSSRDLFSALCSSKFKCCIKHGVSYSMHKIHKKLVLSESSSQVACKYLNISQLEILAALIEF